MEAMTQEDLETTPLQQVDAGPIEDLEIGMEEKIKQIQEQHQKDMEAKDEQHQRDMEAKDEQIQQLERELKKRKRRSSSFNEVL